MEITYTGWKYEIPRRRYAPLILQVLKGQGKWNKENV